MLTLRLTETEQKALDQCVRMGWYKSRSEAVREALGLLFAQHRIKGEAVEEMQKERRQARPRKSNLAERLRQEENRPKK